MVRKRSWARSRGGWLGRLAFVAALGLAAYGCLQLAAFDDLRFGASTPSASGGGGGAGGAGGGFDGAVTCRNDTDCPGSICQPPRCHDGACTNDLAPAETDCSAEGGDHCNGAGICTVDGFGWSKGFGATAGASVSAEQHGYGVAIDGAGNVIVVGQMSGTVDFGGACGSLTSQKGGDAFLLELDSDGTCQFADRWGDDERQAAYAVAVDPLDHAWVVGEFAGAMQIGDFELHSPMQEVSSDGGVEYLARRDLFVAKLGADSHVIWADNYGDDSDQYGAAVACDESGNAFVAGRFQGTLDFGPGGALESWGDLDAFVVKLGPTGVPQWAVQLGGEGTQVAEGIAVDPSGDVVVVGWFNLELRMEGQPPHPAETLAAPDGFVVKLAADGYVLWTRTVAGQQWQQLNAVSSSNVGAVVAAGVTVGTTTLDGDAGASVGADGGTGSSDALFVAVDSNGDGQALLSFGDSLKQQALAVALGPSDEPVLTGSFSGLMQFDGGRSIQGFTDEDVFLVRLTLDGQARYAYRFGAVGGQLGRAVATEGNRVVLVGDFQNDVSFGGEPLHAKGSTDAFVAQYDLTP